jgi:hypothetical protein
MQNKTTRAGRDGGENQGWFYLVVLYKNRFRRHITFFSKIQDVKKMVTYDTKSFERECLVDTDFFTFGKNGKKTHSFHSNPVLLPEKKVRLYTLNHGRMNL